MISESNVVMDGHGDRRGLDEAAPATRATSPPEVVAHRVGGRLRAAVPDPRAAGAAAHPTGYLLEDGVVEAVEIDYRGAYPLRCVLLSGAFGGSSVRTSMIVAVLCTAGCGGGAVEGPTAPESGAGGDERAEAVPRLLDEEQAARMQAQAMQTHVRARALQARCDEEGDREACEQAEDMFGLAADTWRALVVGRPNDEAIVDWSFMLSQALFHSGHFADAAEAADRYVQSGASQWRIPAARILVEASERAIEAEVLPVREEPPEPEGQPPEVEPIEMPEHVRRLFDARARFVEIAGDDLAERETVRRYALANAELLYRYGHWERAEEALTALFQAGCAGEGAWEGGAAAWRMLRAMYLSLGRYDAVRLLGEELGARGCDFGEEGTPACAEGSEHPRCLARSDRVSWRLQGGMRFLQRAERTRGEERQRWARRAGEAFLAALNVEGELDARGRVTALVEAGRAFRDAGDTERASEVDRRILREVDPDALEEEDRPFARVTIASALSRLLEAAVAAEDHGQVIELARRLVADDLDLPELSTERERARAVLAETLSAMGRHVEASRAYDEVATATEDPAERRAAELASALELLASGSCARARRPLRTFAEAHGEEPQARDGVIRALWELAMCERSGSRAHTQALEAVARAGSRSGPSLSPESRAYVAEAVFRLVDRDFDAATRFRIRVGRGENIEDLGAGLDAQLVESRDRLRSLIEGYARVERIGDPRWAISARYRAGQALEALERAVLEASWEIPADLHRQRRDLTPAAFAQLLGIVESRAREILAARAEAVRCSALGHYQRAVQLAETADVDSDEVRAARERIAAIRVSERCRPRR